MSNKNGKLREIILVLTLVSSIILAGVFIQMLHHGMLHDIGIVDLTKVALNIATICFGFLGIVLLSSRTISANTSAEETTNQTRQKEREHWNALFSSAVSHLGHDSIHMRILGISELVQLVEEQEDFRKRACDNLKTFTIARLHQLSGSSVGPSRPVDADIRDALSALQKLRNNIRNRNEAIGKDRDIVFITLERCSISSVDLSGMNFNSFHFIGIHFKGVDLTESSVIGSIFEKCTFNLSSLNNTKMQDTAIIGCTFTDCDLTGARIVDEKNESDIRNSTFERCIIDEADLTNRTIQDCKFIEAQLDQVNFEKARITDTSFNKATGKNVVFSEAEITNCNFEDIDFMYAKFSNSRISNADFEEGELEKSSFNKAHMKDGTNLSGVKMNGASCLGTIFEDVDFLSAEMDGAKMNQASFLKVKNLTEEQLATTTGTYTIST